QSLAAVAEIISTLPHDPICRLHRVDIVQDRHSGTQVVSGKALEIVIEYEVFQAVCGLHFCFMLRDTDGSLLFESLHNGDTPAPPLMMPGTYRSRAVIPANLLANRSYELQIDGGIHRVRHCVPQPSPIRIPITVVSSGLVNRAYPGYQTPGKLAPL